MFGFQRIGDLIWQNADARGRGFLVGATAGRTTLAGEGLQHQDGHTHVYSLATPNCLSYDPAYAYELAVIIQDGIRRMYRDQESVFYYLTVMNEQYAMPAMPEGSRDGILKGMYRLQPAANPNAKLRAQLFGSGAILNEVLAAQKMLEIRYVGRRLERDELPGAPSRWSRVRSAGTCCIRPKPRAFPYVGQCLKGAPGVLVAASDF
jgi:pyruvate dehydrogenase E1 component